MFYDLDIMLNKEITIKIYKQNGDFVTTLSNSLISTWVAFDKEINIGHGRLTLQYHWWDIFAITDIIQVNESDRVIYRWWITNKKITINSIGESIVVEAVGLQTLLKDQPVTDWTVTGDPSTLINNILTAYNAINNIFIPDLTTYGTSISIGYEKDTMRSAIQKIIQNQQRYIHFTFPTTKNKVTLVYQETGDNHKCIVWKHINNIEINNNWSNIKNDVTLIYNTGTLNVADSTSISLFWEKKLYIYDDRIKNLTTAEERVAQELKKAYPKLQTTAIINREYDIESIEPWDTITISNTNHEIIEKRIEKINYTLEQASVQLDDVETLENSIKKSLSSN